MAFTPQDKKAAPKKPDTGLQDIGKTSKQVRSLGCSPEGNMSSHPGVLSGSPKCGAKGTSPTASSIKGKKGKLQPVRTLTAIQSPNLDVNQTSSLVRSRPSQSNQKPSNTATKVSTAPRNPQSSPPSSLKFHNKSSPRAGRESFSKVQGLGSAETIIVGGKDVARIKDTKIVPIDGLPQTADNLTSEIDVQLTLALEEAAEKQTVNHALRLLRFPFITPTKTRLLSETVALWKWI